MWRCRFPSEPQRCPGGLAASSSKSSPNSRRGSSCRKSNMSFCDRAGGKNNLGIRSASDGTDSGRGKEVDRFLATRVPLLLRSSGTPRFRLFDPTASKNHSVAYRLAGVLARRAGTASALSTRRTSSPAKRLARVPIVWESVIVSLSPALTTIGLANFTDTPSGWVFTVTAISPPITPAVTFTCFTPAGGAKRISPTTNWPSTT